MDSWLKSVSLLDSDFLRAIEDRVASERLTKTIFPPRDLVFNSLNQVAFDNTKVVILGQDPYHGKGQAHGLAFSVPEGVKIPPSLRNIFKEINDDVYSGEALDHSTDLTRWAKQGVLLLNATLTVEEGKPESHKSYGWDKITDQIIEVIGKKRENVVFMLWGGHARAKKKLIDADKHLILEAPHPSPLSSYRGFFGCKHFSKCNEYLVRKGRVGINW